MTTMRRAFSPLGFWGDASWGFAPGWDKDAPWALSGGTPEPLPKDRDGRPTSDGRATRGRQSSQEFVNTLLGRVKLALRAIVRHRTPSLAIVGPFRTGAMFLPTSS
jgi:hypothetical protein